MRRLSYIVSSIFSHLGTFNLPFMMIKLKRCFGGIYGSCGCRGTLQPRWIRWVVYNVWPPRFIFVLLLLFLFFFKKTPLLGVGSIQLVAMTRGAMSLTHADYSKNAIMQTCRLLRTHVCHDGDSTLHNSCLSSSFST